MKRETEEKVISCYLGILKTSERPESLCRYFGVSFLFRMCPIRNPPPTPTSWVPLKVYWTTTGTEKNKREKKNITNKHIQKCRGAKKEKTLHSHWKRRKE